MSNILQFIRKYLSKLLLAITVSINFSCTVKPDDLSGKNSIEEIITLAEKAKGRRAYKEAGDFYMEVDRLYPYSDEARKVLVEAMKTYHKGEDLSNARLAAKRYLMLYPVGPAASFSQYMIGLSFFDSIVDVRRDQGAALHAVTEFRKLSSNFPQSSYVDLANEKMQIALSQLAGQEMSVGRYYMKREEYLAAINRFSTVVNKYTDTIFAVEAFYRLTESYAALGMGELALENNDLLIATFPSSEWTVKSSQLVKDLSF